MQSVRQLALRCLLKDFLVEPRVPGLVPRVTEAVARACFCLKAATTEQVLLVSCGSCGAQQQGQCKADPDAVPSEGAFPCADAPVERSLPLCRCPSGHCTGDHKSQEAQGKTLDFLQVLPPRQMLPLLLRPTVSRAHFPFARCMVRMEVEQGGPGPKPVTCVGTVLVPHSGKPGVQQCEMGAGPTSIQQTTLGAAIA